MHWIFSLLLVFSAGGSLMNCDDQPAPESLTAIEARTAAEKALAGRLSIQPEAYREAAAGAAAADPLLVKRLDVPAGDYYIVPFVREAATTLIVLVDATDGRFKEMSYLQEPGVYPAVSSARARQLLSEASGKPVADGEATLVWKPSHQSQSPYEPFWRLEIESGGVWYVDQTGGVSDEIREPELKGGGPPPGA